ncbi:hypothetical protein EW145_g9 [Phellinidium pouzarii]|uniref:MARVEL domain-containing protein n=1 Tax=Phellinidium pouzarii TaxID=167371 RepID=A0A4S4LQF4_9AGAM|nr:hypothetical protein EW145_g9 [Phellinidium pouzarii]
MMLWRVRVGLLAAVLLFSIIMLGLSAGYIAKVHGLDGGFIRFSVPDYAGLGLAISIITLIIVGPIRRVVIDLLRVGAITSLILVELPVIGVLMILWLATAADTAAATSGGSVDCSTFNGLDSSFGTLCHTYQAMEAFSFLTWICLLGYFITLLVFALIAQFKGSGVWHSTVRDTDFFASRAGAGTNVPMMTQDRPAAQSTAQTVQV